MSTGVRSEWGTIGYEMGAVSALLWVQNKLLHPFGEQVDCLAISRGHPPWVPPWPSREDLRSECRRHRHISANVIIDVPKFEGRRE